MLIVNSIIRVVFPQGKLVVIRKQGDDVFSWCDQVGFFETVLSNTISRKTSHNIIVQKHKGTLAVKSQPGQTRFVIHLPVDGA